MRNNSRNLYDEDQKAEIQAGMDAHLDISYYARPEFLAIQMRQIRMGLEEGLDVAEYADPKYDWFQMEEIRKGMVKGIDYSLYARPEIDYRRMRQIRIGLQDGVNLSTFIRLEAGILEELRKSILAKVSLIEYIKEGYNVEQLTEIRSALEKRLEIRKYISVEFIGPSIREIALGLEEKLPVDMYAGIEYDWRQMREIRLGLEERLDVSRYMDPFFSWQQMQQIRLGLEEGIDISLYRKFLYTAQDMEKIRCTLMKEETEHILRLTSSEIADEMLSLFISNDEMEACIEVVCDDNIRLKKKDIITWLADHGVSKGILGDAIEELVNEKKYHRTIVVAKGLQPQKGTDGWYEYFFDTKPNRSPTILADGTADYRSINWYVMVKEKQKVAYYHSAGYGMSGYTVTGKVVNARKGKEIPVLSGKGFELLGDGKTYIAALSGKIELYQETRLEITRAIVLDEVNLATGDVNFDGSVYVRGNVGNGSTIFATENVVVQGFMEAATIKCGADVLLRQGVNGSGVGRIEARGNVDGQFFESVKVFAGGNISAHYCLNCELYTDNMIRIHGTKGMLAGGIARAARGIVSYTIGNKARLKTVLSLGIDAATQNKKYQLEGKIDNVKRELMILNYSLDSFRAKYSPEVRNTMEIYLKIENAIYTKNLQLEELGKQKQQLEEGMKEMQGAKVVVGGILYEGTKVSIDNFTKQLFTIRDVTIRCANQKIVVESN